MASLVPVEVEDIPRGKTPLFSASSEGVHVTPAQEFFPTEWQLEDLDKLVDPPRELKTSSANWSQMRCYKTSTALWLAERLGCRNILIITSKTGKIPYQQAIPKTVPQYHVMNVDMGDPFFAPNPNIPMIYLAHYDVFALRLDTSEMSDAQKKKVRQMKPKQKKKYRKLSNTAQSILDIEWDMVILSEAHKIKNRTTSWTETIKKIRAKHKHVETGTGFVNRPDEAWSILNFLDKRAYRGYWKFRTEFCLEEIDDKGFRKVVGNRPGKVKKFKETIYSFGVRRLFADVFDASELLPPVKVNVDLNDVQRKMYNDIRKEMEALDQAGELLFSPTVLSALTRLRQICVATPEVLDTYFDEERDRLIQKIGLKEPSSKIDALMNILEDTDTPSIVFSQFRDPIEMVKKRLDAAKINSIVLRQKDSEGIRLEKVELFQTGSIPVFLTTLGLGSESITLHAADKVIFLDRSWSPATNDQAIARAWNPDAVHPVAPIYIEARKTVDQLVEKRLKQKAGWFKEIFG